MLNFHVLHILTNKLSKQNILDNLKLFKSTTITEQLTVTANLVLSTICSLPLKFYSVF